MDSASLFSNMTSASTPSQQQANVARIYATTSSFKAVGTQSTSRQAVSTILSPSITGSMSQMRCSTRYECAASSRAPPQQHYLREDVVTREVPALFGTPMPDGTTLQLTGTVSGVSAVQTSLAAGLCVVPDDAPNASIAFIGSLSYFHYKNSLPSEAQMRSLLSLPAEQQLAAGYDASRDHSIDPRLSVQHMPGVHISSQGSKQLDHCLAYLRIAARYQDHGRVFAIALITRYPNGRYKVDHLPTQVGIAPTHTLCMYRTITVLPNKSLTEIWRAMVLPSDAPNPQPEPAPPLRITKKVESRLAQLVQNGKVDLGEQLNGMLLAGNLDSIPRHLLVESSVDHPLARSQHPAQSNAKSRASLRSCLSTAFTTDPDWPSLDPYANLTPSSILLGHANLASTQITGPTILRLALEYTNAEIHHHILQIAQSEGGTVGPNSITKRITNALKSYITHNLGLKVGEDKEVFEAKYIEVRQAYNRQREANLIARGRQVHMRARNHGGWKRNRDEKCSVPAKRLRTKGRRQMKREEDAVEEMEEVLNGKKEVEDDASPSFLQTLRRSARFTQRQTQNPAQTEGEEGEGGASDEDEMSIDDESNVSDWDGE